MDSSCSQGCHRADPAAILDDWLPLTYALNAVNPSMGRDDLYPFVLSAAVMDKHLGARVVDEALARAAGYRVGSTPRLRSAESL